MVNEVMRMLKKKKKKSNWADRKSEKKQQAKE